MHDEPQTAERRERAGDESEIALAGLAGAQTEQADERARGEQDESGHHGDGEAAGERGDGDHGAEHDQAGANVADAAVDEREQACGLAHGVLRPRQRGVTA